MQCETGQMTDPKDPFDALLDAMLTKPGPDAEPSPEAEEDLWDEETD